MTKIWKVVAVTLVGGTFAVSPAWAGAYVLGGTLVSNDAGVDDGAMVCAEDGSRGVGGNCLFPADRAGRNGVMVNGFGTRVAFQVCIDNTQDFLCSGGDPTGAGCADEFFFSHDDSGAFYNPVGGPGVIPQTYTCGPRAGSPANWLVFVCTGVHGSTEVGFPHTHPTPLTGTITSIDLAAANVASSETAFCQPSSPIAAKAYRIVGPDRS